MVKVIKKKTSKAGNENKKNGVKNKRLEKETLEMLGRGDEFGGVLLDLLGLFVIDWKDYGSAAIGLAKAVAALKHEARNEAVPVDKLFQSQLEHFEKVFSNID